MIEIIGNNIQIKQATSKGYIEIPLEDNGAYIADLSFPKSKTRRGRVENNGKTCPTITTTGGLHVMENLKHKVKIRKLTPEECFILMGMTPEDCQKCRDVGLSDSALYKAAGNGLISQCVQLIMEHVYKTQYDENFKCYDENFC